MSITKQKQKEKKQNTANEKHRSRHRKCVLSSSDIFFLSLTFDSIALTFIHSHSLTHINTRKSNHCISRIHLLQTHSRTCILRWKRVRKILYIGSSQFGFSRVNEPKNKTKTKQPISAEVRFSRLLLTKKLRRHCRKITRTEHRTQNDLVGYDGKEC